MKGPQYEKHIELKLGVNNESLGSMYNEHGKINTTKVEDKKNNDKTNKKHYISL